MNMTSNDAVPDAAQANARWAALGAALATFIVYYASLHAVAAQLAPLVKTIPAPAGAPAAWWHVLQSVVVAGTADLVGALLPLWLYLRARGRRMRDLGLSRPGTGLAWILVLAAQTGLVWFDMRMGPIGHVPDPLNAYALAASAFAGPAAAFSEEIFFRGFVMDELERGGFGVAARTAISMVLFGGAHFSYLHADWTIPVFTGLLGGFWSLVYVTSKRSLWPGIAAHIVNDAVVIPSAFYLLASHGLR